MPSIYDDVTSFKKLATNHALIAMKLNFGLLVP